MKAVLDTNILVSGIFFGGVPRKVLDAWAEGRFELLLTPSIFDEYNRTCCPHRFDLGQKQRLRFGHSP